MTNQLQLRIETLMQGDEFDGLAELVSLGTEAVPILMDILQNHLDMFMRARAAVVLGQIGDSQAVPALTSALSSSASLQRLTAAQALADISGTDATETLIDLLNDPDPTVHKTVVQCLAKVGNETALAALERVKMESLHEFMRPHVDAAIRNIQERIA